MFLISNVKPVNTEKEKTAAFLADLGWRRAYLHPFTVEHFQKAAEQAIRDCSRRGITSFILNPHEPLDRLFLEPILRLREEAAIQWYAFFVYEAEETEFLSSEELKVVELRKTVSGTGYLYPRLRSGGMSYLPSKPKIAMNHYCACVMNYCHVLIGGFYAVSNVHRLTEQASISLINLYQDCYYDIHPESPKWARTYDPYRSPKDCTRCIRSLIQDARFRDLKIRLSNERLEYAMLRCPWKRGFDWIYQALNQAMQYAVEFCTHYAFQCSLRKEEAETTGRGIIGGSGSGKTYTMQTVLSRLRMQGIPVTIIAPLKAHEFRRLCSALEGEYIKFSPSSRNTINMLEIRVPRQVTDESLMLMKVARLHAPFSLMFGEGREGGMTMVEKQYLDDKLIELYEGFGITADNKWTRRKEKKMPLLGHLYDALKDDPNTQRLAVMLKPYVFGSMRIFNEHTNVDLSNQYVVMDVCELTSDDAITLYMLQCLEIFTDFLKEDITQRKAIAIDEIWRLIGMGGNGGGNRVIAAWVLELVKTIRGLGGSIISATQDVEDCFSLDGGIYGKALINNSRIKMLMGMEEHEAEIMKGVMNLSEEEKARLTSFPRGHGLFYSGRNHIAIHVRASEAEHRFITTDRAELERMKEAGVAV